MKSLVALVSALMIILVESDDTSSSDNIPCTPSALTGLLISGFLVFVAVIGFAAISSVHVPKVFPDRPFIYGKES